MAQSGQFQLSIILRAVNQMGGPLKGGVRDLRSYGKEAKNVLAIQRQLRAAFGKSFPTGAVDKYTSRMRAAAKETRAFGTEQGKLGCRFSQPTSTKGIDAQLGKLREYRREMRAAARDTERARSTMRGRTSASSVVPVDPLLVSGMGGRRRAQPRAASRRRYPRLAATMEGIERADDFLTGARQIRYAWGASIIRSRATPTRAWTSRARRRSSARSTLGRVIQSAGCRPCATRRARSAACAWTI